MSKYTMSSLAELRKELREARKETVKAPSRMKKGDILMELEKMKGTRESTPPVASTCGGVPMKAEMKVKDVKKAKEQEFPMKPVAEEKAMKAKAKVPAKAPVAEKKPSKMEKLMKMMAEMSDSE